VIDNIGTLAEWRGRGVASQLITAALAKYREEGMQFDPEPLNQSVIFQG